MKKLKLLNSFANVEGIFFPIGDITDGGTCEFSTDICREECCAKKEGSGIINFDEKTNILNYFIEYSVDDIAGKICDELYSKYGTSKISNKQWNPIPIISWFASGDCPILLTNKMYKVIKELKDCGIIQNGITRNVELWRLLNKIQNTKTRFLLTIEELLDEDKEEEGLFAFPDYKKVTFDVAIYKKEKRYIGTGCGGGYYEDHYLVDTQEKKVHQSMDCRNCYKNKLGCFIKINK